MKSSFVCVDAPHSLGEGRGFAWWSQAPDGARSYEAERFVGADESLDAIRAAWTDQPFDALLGHSQGAMLAAMVVAGCARDGVRPRAAIMTGAAWPRPFGDARARTRATTARLSHLTGARAGRADGINPPEMGLEVAECCGAEALVHWHDGGHTLPSDAASGCVCLDRSRPYHRAARGAQSEESNYERYCRTSFAIDVVLDRGRRRRSLDVTDKLRVLRMGQVASVRRLTRT